jgi:hypothetical protein
MVSILLKFFAVESKRPDSEVRAGGEKKAICLDMFSVELERPDSDAGWKLKREQFF